ncbi:MAG: hypothetical protein OHK0052_25570 [Anaerolineales bacterium]
MAQLRRDYAQFIEQNTEILVLGPETRSAFANYWQREDLPFVGLPDPTHSVLKHYGQEVSLFKFGRMPAQVMVDRAGIARYVHYGHNAADIPKNEELLTLLANLNRENATT